MDARAPDAAGPAVAFGRALRAAGVPVPLTSTVAFGEALAITGIADRDTVYWAGMATLVRRPEDREAYHRAFGAFWERLDGGPGGPGGPGDEPRHATLAIDGPGGEQPGGDGATRPGDPRIELRFSAVEVLRHKDFSQYTAAELAEAQRLMRGMRLAGEPRRALRLTAATRHTDRPDLRRTLRAAMRAGGEPIRRHFRQPAERRRRLVLLLDVSGSMQPYARALLRFVQATVAGRQKVEAFALGTRLTRLTRELSSRDPDEALRRAAARMVDYGGGTRLGDGLRAFNDQWGQRGMARGAIVVILSDGWDRGDPARLDEQMARLARAAHRVVWVNPLRVTPGYAPLARGMAAALPHVDAFVDGHSLDALDSLARLIGTGLAVRARA